MRKENLQMKNLTEGTFEEAIEDEPNDEIVRFDHELLSLCVL